MNLRTTKTQQGFTIVELLIVIVVIGILAAITIVAFNGVQNQAKTTKAQAVASDVQKKAEAYNAQHGRYPVSADEFTGVAALSSGNGVTISNGQVASANRETHANYYRCPLNADADTITGAYIRYWNFTSNSTTSLANSLKVGNC